MSDFDFTAVRSRIDSKLEHLRIATASVTAEEAALVVNQERITTAIKAKEIATAVGRKLQEDVRVSLSSLVTRVLAAVFRENSYEFVIKFVERRGKMEVDLLLARDGMELDPLRSVGGGVCDVVAFALRVSVMLRQNPPVRRLLVLDEPLRFLSARYQPAAREMLEKLCSELGVQLIMVTHSPKLAIGNLIEIA